MGETRERQKGEWAKQEKEKVKEKYTFFYTHKLNIWSYGKLHVECEERGMNPASGQQCASLDAGRMNPTTQRPG